MRTPNPNRACGHGNCKRAYADHGKGFLMKLCPGFEEPPHQVYKSAKSHGASQSFTAEQVKLLEAVLRGLLTAGSPLARNAAMPSLMRKVSVMRKRIDAIKET